MGWLLIVFLVLLVLFIAMTVHVWKNREEYFEAAGLELPPQLRRDKGGRKKDGYRQAHGKRPKKVSTVQIPKQKTKPKKHKRLPINKSQTVETEENKEISDATIDTNRSPVKDMSFIKGEGLLTAITRDGELKVAFFVKDMPPLIQTISFSNSDINRIAVTREDGILVYFSETKRKLIGCARLSTTEENGEMTADLTGYCFENAFKNSIQTLIAAPENRYLISLTDKQLIRVFKDGIDFEYLNPTKTFECAVVDSNFSKLFVGGMGKVEVFSLPELDLLSSIKTDSTVISIDYSPSTNSIVCALSHGAIWMISDAGNVVHKWEAIGIRTIRASPSHPYLAFISQKSNMSIISMDEGDKLYNLEEAHHDEIQEMAWSGDGSWILVSSRKGPHIESFRFQPPPAQKSKSRR